MTMNPYILGKSPMSSSKPLMVFTGTVPEYSIKDNLYAVKANLFPNKGPDLINTPPHQNWILRRKASVQTTFDGAAQNGF